MFEELANLVFGPIGAVAAVVVFAVDGLTNKQKKTKKIKHAGVNPESQQEEMKADMADEIAAVEKEMGAKMAKVTHINEGKRRSKSASPAKAVASSGKPTLKAAPKAKTSSKTKTSKTAKPAKVKTPKKTAAVSRKKSRKAA